VKKISNAFIFESAVSREAAERKLIDDLLGLFGGRTQPIIAHLIESGSFTREDVREAERILGEHERKDEAS
jgi:predicted transcriptional regulator